MDTDAPAPKIRVDKWLWQARFFKSRALAAEVAGSGRMRINGARCEKPAEQVRPGDVLTFPQARSVRVVRVEALGTRRGPAPEAAGLYTDLEPAPLRPATDGPPQDAQTPPQRDAGAGRPTKRERRALDNLRGGDA